MAEFDRARRYERSVTVAVLTLWPTQDAPPGSDELAVLVSLLPSVVRQSVRETDLVACDVPAERCIVVMPEIGAEDALHAVDRMRRLCATRLACEVEAQTAVFPRDGWMFLELVDVAQRLAEAKPRRPFAVQPGNAAI